MFLRFCLIITVYFIELTTVFAQEENPMRIDEVLETVSDRYNPQANIKLLSSMIDEISQASDSVQAKFFYYLGIAHGMSYNYDSSTLFLEKSVVLAKSAHDTITWIGALNGLGNVNMISDIEKSQSHFESALDLAMMGESEKYVSWQAKLLGSLGGIFFNLGNMENALEYSKNGYSKAKNINDSSTMVTNLVQQSYCLKHLDRLPEALNINMAAADILEKTEDTLMLIYQYFNIAEIYSSMDETENASEYFNKTINLATQFDEFELQAGSLKELGQIELIKNNIEKARSYARQSLDISIANNLLTHIRNAYYLFYEIDFRESNYRSALNYIKKYYQYKDSIESKETVERVEEFKIKYETAEKEKAISVLNFENQLAQSELKRTRTAQVALGALLVLVTLFSGIIYYNQRQKNRLKHQALSGEISELRFQIMELLGKYEGQVDIDFATLNSQLVNPLSEREFDVFKQVFQNKTNKEIADDLYLSINTVKTHLKNIYSKLGVTNRSEALRTLKLEQN